MISQLAPEFYLARCFRFHSIQVSYYKILATFRSCNMYYKIIELFEHLKLFATYKALYVCVLALAVGFFRGGHTIFSPTMATVADIQSGNMNVFIQGSGRPRGLTMLLLSTPPATAFSGLAGRNLCSSYKLDIIPTRNFAH